MNKNANNDIVINRLFTFDNSIVKTCENIAALCNANDYFTHSFFYEDLYDANVSDDNLPSMYVAKKNDMTVGFLSTYSLGDSIEICAFVHPDFEGMGIFKSMYRLFADDYEGYDIYVSCFPSDTKLISFINHFDYQYHNTELLMKYESVGFNNSSVFELLSASFFDSKPLIINKNASENEISYTLSTTDGSLILGEGTAFLDAQAASIHDILIHEEYRNRKYGLLLVKYMINDLCSMKNSILLHVSKENAAAFSLYNKLGFKIVEQLDYYLSML
ncbi:MAG: GNAT family N-acetyltransferase [Lachnospiraceae bacterium]|nr:GNAT family N-acetyltransferase [Lachnospiraceae bacterium]